MRLRYYHQVLTLEINPGITTRESDFETCFRKENVKLSPGGYFGVTAATGALAGKIRTYCIMFIIIDLNINFSKNRTKLFLLFATTKVSLSSSDLSEIRWVNTNFIFQMIMIFTSS